ncbi:MAG TPA: class I SAM-dependent methyltransferase [Solirubrobacteraceae bacterium]|jgi:SAM-dependent methyltransferase|nr:class I SAM-dependent methyltransferase [Solirubrobacteraceae bacterium]
MGAVAIVPGMRDAGPVTDPFLARLAVHGQALQQREPTGPPSLERAEPPPAPVHSNQLAFWQSQVARAAINRRITGDPSLAPEVYFAAAHGLAVPAPHVLSLRGGDARLEVALVEVGSCKRVTGLDTDERRVESANRSVPEALRVQIGFRLGTLMEWDSSEQVGAVLARNVLHRQIDLEGTLDRVRASIVPGGLIFVDDFVGPARFQWTEAQLDAINRLLACLPDELLTDLTAADGRRKRAVSRPSPDEFAASNPHDAVRSDEILGCLDERFERVEVRLHGGALYHQLFTRIMGNFAGRPELVRMVMEVDAMLTDSGVLSSDYVWGVWRRPI